MENQQHNFKTPLDLQERLTIKREELGYEEFYKRVATALSVTRKSASATDLILFGRRYEDDIFESIQLRYSDSTMADIRKLADIICFS